MQAYMDRCGLLQLPPCGQQQRACGASSNDACSEFAALSASCCSQCTNSVAATVGVHKHTYTRSLHFFLFPPSHPDCTFVVLAFVASFVVFVVFKAQWEVCTIKLFGTH